MAEEYKQKPGEKIIVKSLNKMYLVSRSELFHGISVLPEILMFDPAYEVEDGKITDQEVDTSELRDPKEVFFKLQTALETCILLGYIKDDNKYDAAVNYLLHTYLDEAKESACYEVLDYAYEMACNVRDWTDKFPEEYKENI